MADESHGQRSLAVAIGKLALCSASQKRGVASNMRVSPGIMLFRNAATESNFGCSRRNVSTALVAVAASPFIAAAAARNA
jgi:hypothetical protein